MSVLNEIISLINSNLTSESKLTIAISGGSGVGKTSQIIEKLTKNTIYKIIHQDDYVYDKQLVQGLKYKGDNPLSFNNLEIEKELIEYKSKSNTELIIFEGIYSSYGDLEKLSDLKIYLEAPFYTRLIKRYFRIVYEKSLVKIQDVFKNTIIKNDAHREFVTTQKINADFVIQTDFSMSYLVEKNTLIPSEILPDLQIVKEFYVDAHYKILIFTDNQNLMNFFALVDDTSNLAFDLIELNDELFDFFKSIDFNEL